LRCALLELRGLEGVAGYSSNGALDIGTFALGLGLAVDNLLYRDLVIFRSILFPPDSHQFLFGLDQTEKM
jgi:hypothetical protein